jgi:hypothetical protein
MAFMTHCDRGGCPTIVAGSSQLPVGWYMLTGNKTNIQEPRAGATEGPLHFCSARCLMLWAETREKGSAT